MNTWLFTATAAKANVEKTFALATDHGLIVRPFFNASKNSYQSRNHNGNLAPGDRLILAFIENGTVVDSAAFILTEDSTRPKVSELVDKDVRIAGKAIPNVFSVFPASDTRFKTHGYDQSSMDPKIGKWVCLNVADCYDEIDEVALQKAVATRSNKYSAINKIDYDVRTDNSESSSPRKKTIKMVECENRLAPAPSPAKNRVAIGVDFSGGRNASKKIWIAETEWANERELRLCRLVNDLTFDDLQKEIVRERPADILLDFPFGLAEQTCTNLGIAESSTYLKIWEKVGGYENAEMFRVSAKAGETGQGSERSHKRSVDREKKTPFAPINLRMFRQTYFGQAKVLLPAKQTGCNSRFLPWDKFDDVDNLPRVGEGCPASMLKALGWPSGGYKGTGPISEGKRSSLLCDLEGIVQLTMSIPDKNQIIADTEGDALDALLLAVGAAHLQADELEAGRQSSGTHQTEGFVYLGLGFFGGIQDNV